MKNSTKRFNIYTSSSGSEEENLNADLRKLPSLSEPNKIQLDDPEDNLTLSELKKHAEKSPFHKQIPTPNFATIKYKPRRKALNYIGQKITKDLFAEEETAKNTKRTTKKTKPSKKELKKKSNELKKVLRERRQNEDINKKVTKAICVCLTKDDEEQFICPECN
ncbi:unnamed protein product [Euphydryas editha]|uniref:Uncharacterized protein n=1 Tax=Euphydryas editha TaxID=104508 RepID=A0AAU9VBI8_EUPED|nr:unnamed protein product [Euphydryas editha]